MKAWDNEFYMLMNEFDKYAYNKGFRIDKEKDHTIKNFYQNGETDKLFKSYMNGYMLKKSINNNVKQSFEHILKSIPEKIKINGYAYVASMLEEAIENFCREE